MAYSVRTQKIYIYMYIYIYLKTRHLCDYKRQKLESFRVRSQKIIRHSQRVIFEMMPAHLTYRINRYYDLFRAKCKITHTCISSGLPVTFTAKKPCVESVLGSITILSSPLILLRSTSAPGDNSSFSTRVCTSFSRINTNTKSTTNIILNRKETARKVWTFSVDLLQQEQSLFSWEYCGIERSVSSFLDLSIRGDYKTTCKLLSYFSTSQHPCWIYSLPCELALTQNHCDPRSRWRTSRLPLDSPQIRAGTSD